MSRGEGLRECSVRSVKPLTQVEMLVKDANLSVALVCFYFQRCTDDFRNVLRDVNHVKTISHPSTDLQTRSAAFLCVSVSYTASLTETCSR